jgi:peptidylglycine monooxygenase
MTSESQTIVLGERHYRVDTPWGQLPAGKSLGLVSQLAVDSRGSVYVLQRANPPITVFDATGAFVREWGDGLILDGHGICIAPDDRVYIVDRDAHQIVVFDTSGRVMARIGERHRPRHGAPFNHPTDLAIAADGEIYVSDGYGNSLVHRFDPDGRLIASWGEPGGGPGQFSTPHAVWVDRQDRVLVADREHDRVQLFDRQGHYLAAWGDFYHPMDICEDLDGMVLVSDQTPRLTMMAPDGRLAGRCRPVLNGGHGVWADHDGNIFLAEMIPSRVTRLSPVD